MPGDPGEGPPRHPAHDPPLNKKTSQGSGGDFGPIERTTRADVAALVTEHPMGEALAETAYHLARVLDDGKAGMATAAVARQLVATLTELAAHQVRGDDDELGDLLSTPVRDPEN